jgi:transposase
MSCFPSAAHLAAWAGLAPGNYESAGKQLSGKTRKGNQTLRAGLMQSAHVASRSHTYLAAQYRRITVRRGKKRATMAVAHSILVIAYYVIQRQEPYRELGANYFDQKQPEMTTKKLVKRLEGMGYQVTLEPQSASAA